MSLNKTNFFWLLFLAVFLVSGCGQKVSNSIAPIETTMPPENAKGRIVVLPFADYTMGKRLDDSLRRQVKIHEALIYRMAQYGYYAPVEDDVIQYMIDRGVITLVQDPVIDTAASRRAIEREMGNGWSENMQEQIRTILMQNDLANVPQRRFTMEKVGLTKDIIRQMGRYFGADYVLRGRIVEYDIRQGGQLNPVQQGLLPFFFDWSSSLIFGVAKSEEYDLWQDMSLGAAIGAGIGSQADSPFNKKHTETSVTGSHPRGLAVVTSTAGHTDAGLYNATIWGAAGAAAAYMASKGGKIPQGVVQLSLALQDARTGHVIWANRAEKVVEPKSAWADPSERKQIDLAVEEAARVLIEDMGRALAMLPDRTSVVADSSLAAPAAAPGGVMPVKEESAAGAAVMDNNEKPSNWGS